MCGFDSPIHRLPCTLLEHAYGPGLVRPGPVSLPEHREQGFRYEGVDQKAPTRLQRSRNS